MKTLAVVIGKRPDSAFKRIIAELKSLGFMYHPLSKEWSKPVEDDKLAYWLKQLSQAGLQAYIKE